MMLATPAKVLETLALQSRGSNDDAAAEGLMSATPIIEHVLGTSVSRGMHEDLFCVDRLWERNSSDVFWAGNVKLLLDAGLLCDGQPVRATLYANISDASNGDNGQSVPKTAIFTDQEAGVVKTIAVIGDWLRIRYTAGFEEAEGVYQGVPPWLERAAISGAVRYMRAFQTKWNEKNIRDTKEEIHRLMELQLTAKIRTKYGTFPYHTKELA